MENKTRKRPLCLLLIEKYSGPSLSGPYQQRPSSLICPQTTTSATTTNLFTSPHQRPPLGCGHNVLANRMALLGDGPLYSVYKGS